MELHLEPWSERDLELLWIKNTPEMTDHLGGPETDEKVRRRHERYLAGEPDGGGMFRVALPSGEGVGTIGYWARDWHDERVYETGWGVIPAYQGMGVATSAARLVIAHARAHGRFAALHAFPSIDHPASNAVCRKAGFTLAGETPFEYPPGRLMSCNDWKFDLQ